MRYRTEYADGRCCNFANSRKDLLDWLKALKDEKIVAAMPISEGHIVPIEPGSRMHAYFYTVKGIFSCENLDTERG